MILFGIILMICGGAASLWANNMQNSFEYNWYGFWGSSDYSYVDVIYYVGIFAFIVGVIFLIVGCAKNISKNTGTEKIIIQNNTDVQNKKRCLHCGNLISKDDGFCQFCGKKQFENSVKNNILYCKICGSKINENAQFCSNCGRKIGE